MFWSFHSFKQRGLGACRYLNQCLLAEASVLIRLASEGRGFSPAAKNRPLLGALVLEAAMLQGLKAPFNRALRSGGAKAPPFQHPEQSHY